MKIYMPLDDERARRTTPTAQTATTFMAATLGHSEPNGFDWSPPTWQEPRRTSRAVPGRVTRPGTPTLGWQEIASDPSP